MRIELSWLGQSGLRLAAAGCVVYVDPYLSDSVATIHGSVSTQRTMRNVGFVCVPRIGRSVSTLVTTRTSFSTTITPTFDAPHH